MRIADIEQVLQVPAAQTINIACITIPLQIVLPVI